MAFLFDENGDRIDPGPEGVGQGATFGDIGRATGESALSIPAEAASSGQYAAEQADMPKSANVLKAFSDLFHGGEESLESGITPGGKRAREAALSSTEGGAGYGETPFSSIFMKTANMSAPMAVMALFSETLIGDAVVGGALQAGQVIDDVIAKTNKLDDKELAAQSPVFKAYLDSGMDPDAARAQLHHDQISGRDIAVAGLIGAVTMGAPARVLKAGAAAGKGVVKRAVTGAAEAGAGAGVSAGEADVQAQKAELAAKKKFDPADIDWHRTMETGLTSLIEGGALGAGGGALHGKRGAKEPAVETEAPPTAPEQPPPPVTPEGVDARAGGTGFGGAPTKAPVGATPGPDTTPAPPPGMPAGATQTELDLKPPAVAPTGPPAPSGQGDLFAPKGLTGHGTETGAVDTAPAPRKGKKTSPEVQTVGENAPDAGQTAALAGSGVGPTKPSDIDEAAAGKIDELKKPPAEAVPTTPAPAAKTAAQPTGVPDEHVATSQPPKGASAGAPGKPPDTRVAEGTDYPKGEKGGVGPKGKKAIETAAPAAPDVTQTEALKPPPPPEPVETAAPAAAEPPPEAAPTRPAPPEAPPAQAPPAAQPAPGAASLADLLRQHEADAQRASPTVPSARAEAVPPAGAPAVRAPDVAPSARPEAARAPSAADMPTPEAQEVSAQAPGTAVAQPRVLEGGSAAPAYDQALIKPLEERAAAQEAQAPRGEKGKTYAEDAGAPVAKAEHQAAVREANKAVKTDLKGAHPLHVAIAREAEIGRQMGRGQSPEKTAQADKVRGLVRQLREAKASGEIQPKVAKGGKPKQELAPKARAAVDKAATRKQELATQRQAGEAVRPKTAQELRDEIKPPAPPKNPRNPTPAEVAAWRDYVAKTEDVGTANIEKSMLGSAGEARAGAISFKDIASAAHMSERDAVKAAEEGRLTAELREKLETQVERGGTANERATAARMLTQLDKPGQKTIVEQHASEIAARREASKPAGEETAVTRPAAAKAVVTGKSALAGLRPKIEGKVSLARKETPGVGPAGEKALATAKARKAKVTPEVKAEQAAHPETDPAKSPEEKRKSLEELFKEGDHSGHASELAGEKPNGDRLRDHLAGAGDDIRELRDRLSMLTNRELGEIIKTTDRHGPHSETLSEAKKEAELRRQDVEKRVPHSTFDFEAFKREKDADYERNKDQYGTVRVGQTEVRFKKLETVNVGDALRAGEVENHGLLPTGQVALAVSRRVEKLASSVPVHSISAADMREIVAAHPRLRSSFEAGGFYMPHDNIILIREGLSPGQREATVFHEAIHAATSREILANPELKAQVRLLMNEARSRAFGDMHNQYGFTDEHEFIAEAFANKKFREYLASKKMSLELKEKLKLPEWRKSTGFKGQLQTLWDMVRNVFGRALSGERGPVAHETASYLEGALASFDRLSTEQDKWASRDQHTPTASEMAPSAARAPLRREVTEEALPSKMSERYEKLPDMLRETGSHLATATMGSKARQLGHRLMTNDQFRQAKEYLFGAKDESNPMRRLTDAIEKAGAGARDYRKAGDEIARRALQLVKTDPEAGAEFSRLAEEATMHGVHLDRGNGHLSIDGLGDAQAKAVLPKLQADFDKMTKSAPETKKLWTDAVDYFKNTHDAMAAKLIDNHLQGVDTSSAPSGLRQRILDGKMTDADKKLFGPETGKALADAREVQNTRGAYFPLMRRGDFVVQGATKVDPKKGQLIGDNVVQFKNASDAEARRQAKAYAESSPLKVLRTREVWVDGNDPSKLVKVGDPNAEKAFRIEVQHEHVSFHDSEHEANAARAALKADPGMASVKDVMLRKQSPNVDYEVSSAQARTIINAIRQNHSLSDRQKEEMVRTWTDVSHRMIAGNRVETRRVPRRNVAGASRDMVKNIADYSSSTSSYRAKLDHAQEIGDHLAAMEKWADDRQYDGNTLQRNEATREMTDRLYGNLAEMSRTSSPLVQQMMTVSYLKAMGSPAHLLLHSTHPWMISAPYLAGRHGVRAFGALSRAYKDMGGMGAVTEGMKSFGRSIKPGWDGKTMNWLDHFESSFKGKDKADVVRMWRALAETGHIHPEAGMEVHKMDPSNGVLGRGLKRVDTAFREMTGTSEALNRFAESAAAYRLERLKGASHDEAVRYAKDTLANTQGLYSSTNAAPVFRNPYLRPLLQFKQFPQMMYHLLGKSLVTAFKGETKEIRIEAAKQFAGIVATHALMAGAMGLPLEPIRAGMLVANALGAPGMNWAEHEDAWTKYLAEHVGPQAAEIIMHGITRGLGGASFDAHHRLGQGTLAIGMDPRGDSENDLKAWGWDMALGAPGGMVSDFFQGSKEIAGGHVAKGLETILPLKAAVDPIKAVAAYIGGKKTARGNVITPPASIPQTIMRSLGFTPAAEAQANAATASVKRTQLETGRAKADVIQSYLGGKQSAMTDVVRWNAAHPDNQISYSGLMKARREAAAPQALGQKINKANRSLIDTTSRAYNLGGVQ